MTEEINAAVEWWCHVLSEPFVKQDNGDGLQSVCLSLMADLTPMPTQDQIEVFRQELTRELAESIDPAGWHPEEPVRGSYMRTVATDYHPEHVLSVAADRAGIHDNRFPVKTVMWINPGEVKVARGYGAPIKQIWPEGSTA